jgi:hypothetical protein
VTLPVAVHAPSQVIVHVPAEQATLDPAPTVCVQAVPSHTTLQFAPQVPEHVEPCWHVNLQLLVEPEHALNAQLVLGPHSQAVPLQASGALVLLLQLGVAASTKLRMNPRMRVFMKRTLLASDVPR